MNNIGPNGTVEEINLEESEELIKEVEAIETSNMETSGLIANSIKEEAKEKEAEIVSTEKKDNVEISSDISLDEETEIHDENYDEERGIWVQEHVIPQRDVVSDANLSDEETELFFGKSNFCKSKDIDSSSVFSMLDSFKRMGEYLDMYLPVSNVVVRMYEFENDIVLPEMSTVLLEDILFADQLGRQEITHDRALLAKVFENCDIISNAGIVKSDFDMEQLSNLDMNILIIAAAKLILLSDNNVKEKNLVKLADTVECEKCKRHHEVTIDLDKLLRAQYKKMDVEKFRTLYNPDDTFENNFKNSIHMQSRRKGAKYTKDGGNNQILIMCQDPSYIDAVSKEVAALRYLVRKYEQYEIVSDLISSGQYKSSSVKNKMSSIIQTISEHPFGIKYTSMINTDMNIMMAIRYISTIVARVKVIRNGKSTWEMKEKIDIAKTPMETVFNLYKELPFELKDKITSITKELSEIAIDSDIEYRFECTNPECKHITKIPLDSRGLVFTILQARMPKEEQTNFLP